MAGRPSQPRFVSFESLQKIFLDPSDAALYAADAEYEVCIAIGEANVAVRFSRKSAAAMFAERFGDTLGSGSPSVTIYAVATEEGAMFWQSSERARRWNGKIPDSLLVFFADNVMLYEYLSISDDVGFHAAAIGKRSQIAALVGDSATGKTTTAIAAVRNGFQLYSDDRCILQRGRVVPFLRAVTVRPGGRAALLHGDRPYDPIDTRLLALPAHEDQSIRPQVLLGDRAGGPFGTLSAVFIIKGRQARVAVTPCGIHDELPALLRSMVSRDVGLDRPARALRMFGRVSIYRLQLGTPEASAAVIERILDGAPVAR